MTIEEAIQETLACPWCGSRNRAPSQAFTTKPNGYLRAVATKLDLPVEALIERLASVECPDCGASYCDPWLSQAATAWLFNLGYPQHNAAWKSFYDWLDRSEDFEATVFPRKEKIWKFVASKVGPVHSYGEIGCPFMGLFSYFECLKKTPLESFLNFEQRSVQQIRGQHRPDFVPKLSSITRLALKIRRRKIVRRLAQHPPSSGKPSQETRPPSQLYFVRSPSSLLWGGNCQSLSTSCTAMAMVNFNVGVLDISNLRQRLDVLGFFNTLDHQDKPLWILERALEAARFVVIELHRDEKAGKQHLYVINDALARTVTRKGWIFEEFSKHIDEGKGNRLYLVSNNSHVA